MVNLRNNKTGGKMENTIIIVEAPWYSEFKRIGSIPAFESLR